MVMTNLQTVRHCRKLGFVQAEISPKIESIYPVSVIFAGKISSYITCFLMNILLGTVLF